MVFRARCIDWAEAENKTKKMTPTQILAWEQDSKQWRGVVLTGKYKHWCNDWDGLPMDETCPEFTGCLCFEGDEVARIQAALRALEI